MPVPPPSHTDPSKVAGSAPAAAAAPALAGAALRAPVLLTMGDPAGIGPEIAYRAMALHPLWWRQVVLVGERAVLERAREAVLAADPCLPRLPLHTLAPPPAVQGGAGASEWPAWRDWCARPAGPALTPGAPRPVCAEDGLALVQATEAMPGLVLGRVSAQAGRAAADCIEWATRAVLAAQGRAVVTAPIHKEALAAAGLPYPGHTEMLQALAAEHLGVPAVELPVRMMLSCPGLTTVLHSIHVPLRQAIDGLSQAGLLQTLRVVQAHWALSGWAPPRIAVAGLNPHAGEGGLFGREEIDTIAPAVHQAQALGINAVGPLAPDTVFMRARQGEFDLVLAMYHDQGLIPVKLLGLEHGVNTTLGLPLVRTSPDHGTAFDLAGSGRASEQSLVAALVAALSAGGLRPSADAAPR